MAVQLEKILGGALSSGIVLVPQGIFQAFEQLPDLLPSPSTRIKFIEGAKDNLPDLDAYNGALQVQQLVTRVEKDDILIVLISGGGSALLPMLKKPITLEEDLALIKSLSKAGANIMELNTVRRKLSELKGGRLALLAKHARIIGLVLSDVIGDPLDCIASGPTVPNLDSPEAALNIVKKYNLLESTPKNIRKVLTDDNDDATDKHTKSATFDWVYNVVIGSNRIASEAAAQHARTIGYQTVILTTTIDTNVKELSQWYATLVHLLLIRSDAKLRTFLEEKRNAECNDLVQADEILKLDLEKPICLIGSGEPVVVVQGNGRGGRNQELALRFSLEIYKLNIQKNVAFLSAGTDGIDGPTDAAGAIGDWKLIKDARDNNIEPSKFIDNNDSYNFYSIFNQGQYFIKTGHTGTNVMDLHLIVIKP
ncbi:hypothetical protein Trydic_g7672 [Trypoxylus dichotomus]